MAKATARRRSRFQRGEAIVESMLSIMLLCLILFGLLQIFTLSVADMLTKYSSFKTARAASVGLADYLVHRTAQTSVAGASGALLTPPGGYGSNVEQAWVEVGTPPTIDGYGGGLLANYQGGTAWLDYQYWTAGNEGNRTHASVWSNASTANNAQLASGTAGFNNYPLTFLHFREGRNRTAFANEDRLDLSNSARVMNSTADFMD